MKKIKNATDIVRLCTAVLVGISAGLSVAKNTRDLVRMMAEDEGLLEKLVHGKALKENRK
jgi:uncharacterized membrane protein YbjE (DUF340 family)